MYTQTVPIQTIKCSTEQHPAIGVFVGDKKNSRLTALVVPEEKVKEGYGKFFHNILPEV